MKRIIDVGFAARRAWRQRARRRRPRARPPPRHGTNVMAEWFDAHKVLLGWLIFSSFAVLIGTMVAAPLLIVRLPADYFTWRRRPRPLWSTQHPVLRMTLLVAKNVAGWAFVAIGIAMLVLPGQGLLTIFIGLLLADFPRKFQLLRWLVGHRAVLRPANWIRRRAGRPPLQVGRLTAAPPASATGPPHTSQARAPRRDA